MKRQHDQLDNNSTTVNKANYVLFNNYFGNKLVILEGNISAGKSTLSRDLAKILDYELYLEPTLVNPYLSKFYDNPKKYALVMQIWLLRNRYQTYLAAIRTILETGRGVILDRSVFSDYVFAVKNHIDKNISDEGFDYYLKLREKMLNGLPTPAITVYLDVSPQECFDRVHNVRKRDCESGIPLEYLAGLHDCYMMFLDQMEEMGSHVLKYDWNHFGDAAEVANDIQNLTGKLERENNNITGAFRNKKSRTLDISSELLNEQQREQLAQLKELLYNNEKVKERMKLDYILPGLEELDDTFVLETAALAASGTSSADQPRDTLVKSSEGTSSSSSSSSNNNSNKNNTEQGADAQPQPEQGHSTTSSKNTNEIHVNC